MPSAPSAVFKRSALYLALSSSFLAPLSIYAETSDDEIELIEITSSRRVTTVQNTPINIVALNDDMISEQNITNLADVARWVPGLTVPDQGGRYDTPLIMRGLNTNDSGPISDSGTVAVYLGDLPLNLDMKMLDISRIEVLIGPQGTLYGAGTLAGAIRYIANKPVLDESSATVSGDFFNVAASDDIGSEFDLVVNQPLIKDQLAFRVALNYLDAPGYIDYPYAIKEPGVSLPDPDWSNAVEVADNISPKKDVNSQETSSARFSLRWQPVESFDANLSYYYQKDKLGGFKLVHYNALAPEHALSDKIGKYQSAYRFAEPRTKETSLLSLELVADLGFAELTSATGYSEYKAKDTRDQTDRTILLEYGYEEFPSFVSIANDQDKHHAFTQELRLVSTTDSPLSWIVGTYYNKQKFYQDAREYVPGLAEYALDNWGAEQDRPDDLDYIALSKDKNTEKAFFGELTYAVNQDFNITLGARHYINKRVYASAADFPLYYTQFEGAAEDDIYLPLENRSAKDNGNLFKLNFDYQLRPEILSYFTISEGYRAGGSNGLPTCSDDIDIGCVIEEKATYDAETTTNYELGIKSSWFKNRLHINAAIYQVDWNDAQVADYTDDFIPIYVNASNAQSKGFELSTRARINNQWTTYASFAYNQAELEQDAELLDALKGDRLPGSSERQFTFGFNYQTTLSAALLLDINYGLTYQSDVYSRIGLRNDGEKLAGYSLHNLSFTVSADKWQSTFYIDNLFNKYAYSSVRGASTDNDDLVRYYGHYLITPRTAGVKLTYRF